MSYKERQRVAFIMEEKPCGNKVSCRGCEKAACKFYNTAAGQCGIVSSSKLKSFAKMP